MISAPVVCNQINQILGSLVQIGLASDQNLAFVRQLGGNGVEVTFPHAEQVSVALKDRNYREIYTMLDSERAYVAKLPDGALLLLRYMYVGGGLQKHSLGFYPSPDLEEFQNNPDVYLGDVMYADVVARNIVPFPLRFDFDCRDDVFVPCSHPRSHMTMGQYEKCRIPVTAPLTPLCFVSFMLRNFYNTAYCEYSRSLPSFREKFAETICLEERSLMHIHLPQPRP